MGGQSNIKLEYQAGKISAKKKLKTSVSVSKNDIGRALVCTLYGVLVKPKECHRGSEIEAKPIFWNVLSVKYKDRIKKKKKTK